jgi:hypothetical protein
VHWVWRRLLMVKGKWVLLFLLACAHQTVDTGNGCVAIE